MKFCSRCLYSDNHPLFITFDRYGICSGCRIHEEKDIIDWKERYAKLKKIINNYKNKSLNNYDCIIPVSGARDSYFVVHTIKKKLGLKELSMGMSSDYLKALEHGASYLRIGSSIFGERN